MQVPAFTLECGKVSPYRADNRPEIFIVLLPLQKRGFSDDFFSPAYLFTIASDLTEKQFYDEVLHQQIQAVQESHSEMEMRQRELCQTNLALSQANEQLQALSRTNGLTGLKNHRTFQEQFAREFEHRKRYRTPLSLVLLDVDKFKSFNDTSGQGFPIGFWCNPMH